MSYNVANDIFINDALVVAIRTHTTAAVDAATAIGVAHGTFFRDGSTIARAHTLADGANDGDRVVCVKTTGAGVGTITPATFTDGTSIPLTNTGDMVSFVWRSGSWKLNSAINLNTGAAIAVTP